MERIYRDSGSTVTATALGVEAIAEFQILTNTYSAQFGGFGGAINAVSRTGTNGFHGSAYEFIALREWTLETTSTLHQERRNFIAVNMVARWADPSRKKGHSFSSTMKV
jgi:hypothetical protein